MFGGTQVCPWQKITASLQILGTNSDIKKSNLYELVYCDSVCKYQEIVHGVEVENFYHSTLKY